jgi:hypothetical protein
MKNNILDEVVSHLARYDLDIRKTKFSRFMDQKVTPDVVCFMTDCILNLIGDDLQKQFTTKDIWRSQYFIKNVPAIFGKPSPKNPCTSNEYDKFITQPLRMLDYAKILVSEKKGVTYHYKIGNFRILEFLAIKERNAIEFLDLYLSKVLNDSGQIKYFTEYIKLDSVGKLSENHFQALKARFQRFILGNTAINGKTEINRIFPKILNILAFKNNLPGSIKGHLSRDRIQLDDLMYNRGNFRDLNKLKADTRKESAAKKKEIEQQEEIFNEYRVQRAIAIIRKKYSESEVRDKWCSGSADYVHHIFPRTEFRQIAHYLENLIKLTASQHFSKAHPKGNTQAVDKEYQLVCLLAKADSIESSMKRGEFLYSKESFIFVINTGLSGHLDENLTLRQIKMELNNIYQNN